MSAAASSHSDYHKEQGWSVNLEGKIKVTIEHYFRLFLLFCASLSFQCAAQAASFSDLNQMDQERVKNGELVRIPVQLENSLLRGTFLQYLKDIAPIQPASVFFDYDQHYKFVPGMPWTQVIQWSGRRALVRHHINATVFLYPRLQKTMPRWLYNGSSYSYDLNEDVFFEDGTYTIHWEVPKNKRKLGADEQGWIEFKPFENGTLITYENATTPCLYKSVIQYLPFRGFVIDSMIKISQRYYQKTIENLVARLNEVIQTGEIETEISHLNQVLIDYPPILKASQENSEQNSAELP